MDPNHEITAEEAADPSPASVSEAGPDANQEPPQSSGEGAENDANSGEEAKPDLLDIVRSAIEEGTDTGKAEPQDGSSPDDGSKAEGEAKAEAEAEVDGVELTDEDKDADGKPLPFHKHPRWQEIKAQRDELKGEVERFKPDAEQFQVIQNFMAEKNLNAEEVGQGFQVMDMIKNDPGQALEYLKGAVNILEQQLGMVLPEDLAKEVNLGTISESQALELSQARARESMALQTAQTAQQQAQAAQAQQQQQMQAQEIRGAVSAWETQIAQSDPDYKQKAEAVFRFARAIQADLAAQGRAPRSGNEAVAVIEQAYKEVNKTFNVGRPKPATDPVPSSSVSTRKAAPEAPTSLAEAVRLGASMSVPSTR